MIIFFGPPGAGKSVQGQILAARHGWRWLSTGQLLRDSHDDQLHAIIRSGEFVSDHDMNRVVQEALNRAKEVDNLILDGYPRKTEQAEWLMTHLPSFDAKIDVVVVLEVSDDELYQRLRIRGRADDTPENIAKRSQDYREKTTPVLDFFKQQGITVERVDGEGSVGTVHDRIEKAIAPCLQA